MRRGTISPESRDANAIAKLAKKHAQSVSLNERQQEQAALQAKMMRGDLLSRDSQQSGVPMDSFAAEFVTPSGSLARGSTTDGSSPVPVTKKRSCSEEAWRDLDRSQSLVKQYRDRAAAAFDLLRRSLSFVNPYDETRGHKATKTIEAVDLDLFLAEARKKWRPSEASNATSNLSRYERAAIFETECEKLDPHDLLAVEGGVEDELKQVGMRLGLVRQDGTWIEHDLEAKFDFLAARVRADERRIVKTKVMTAFVREIERMTAFVDSTVDECCRREEARAAELAELREKSVNAAARLKTQKMALDRLKRKSEDLEEPTPDRDETAVVSNGQLSISTASLQQNADKRHKNSAMRRLLAAASAEERILMQHHDADANTERAAEDLSGFRKKAKKRDSGVQTLSEEDILLELGIFPDRQALRSSSKLSSFVASQPLTVATDSTTWTDEAKTVQKTVSDLVASLVGACNTIDSFRVRITSAVAQSLPENSKETEEALEPLFSHINVSVRDLFHRASNEARMILRNVGLATRNLIDSVEARMLASAPALKAQVAIPADPSKKPAMDFEGYVSEIRQEKQQLAETVKEIETAKEMEVTRPTAKTKGGKGKKLPATKKPVTVETVPPSQAPAQRAVSPPNPPNVQPVKPTETKNEPATPASPTVSPQAAPAQPAMPTPQPSLDTQAIKDILFHITEVAKSLSSTSVLPIDPTIVKQLEEASTVDMIKQASAALMIDVNSLTARKMDLPAAPSMIEAAVALRKATEHGCHAASKQGFALPDNVMNQLQDAVLFDKDMTMAQLQKSVDESRLLVTLLGSLLRTQFSQIVSSQRQPLEQLVLRTCCATQDHCRNVCNAFPNLDVDIPVRTLLTETIDNPTVASVYTEQCVSALESLELQLQDMVKDMEADHEKELQSKAQEMADKKLQQMIQQSNGVANRELQRGEKAKKEADARIRLEAKRLEEAMLAEGYRMEEAQRRNAERVAESERTTKELIALHEELVDLHKRRARAAETEAEVARSATEETIAAEEERLLQTQRVLFARQLAAVLSNEGADREEYVQVESCAYDSMVSFFDAIKNVVQTVLIDVDLACEPDAAPNTDGAQPLAVISPLNPAALTPPVVDLPPMPSFEKVRRTESPASAGRSTPTLRNASTSASIRKESVGVGCSQQAVLVRHIGIGTDPVVNLPLAPQVAVVNPPPQPLVQPVPQATVAQAVVTQPIAPQAAVAPPTVQAVAQSVGAAAVQPAVAAAVLPSGQTTVVLGASQAASSAVHPPAFQPSYSAIYCEVATNTESVVLETTIEGELNITPRVPTPMPSSTDVRRSPIPTPTPTPAPVITQQNAIKASARTPQTRDIGVSVQLLEEKTTANVEKSPLPRETSRRTELVSREVQTQAVGGPAIQPPAPESAAATTQTQEMWPVRITADEQPEECERQGITAVLAENAAEVNRLYQQIADLNQQLDTVKHEKAVLTCETERRSLPPPPAHSPDNQFSRRAPATADVGVMTVSLPCTSSTEEENMKISHEEAKPCVAPRDEATETQQTEQPDEKAESVSKATCETQTGLPEIIVDACVGDDCPPNGVDVASQCIPKPCINTAAQCERRKVSDAESMATAQLDFYTSAVSATDFVSQNVASTQTLSQQESFSSKLQFSRVSIDAATVDLLSANSRRLSEQSVQRRSPKPQQHENSDSRDVSSSALEKSLFAVDTLPNESAESSQPQRAQSVIVPALTEEATLHGDTCSRCAQTDMEMDEVEELEQRVDTRALMAIAKAIADLNEAFAKAVPEAAHLSKEIQTQGPEMLMLWDVCLSQVAYYFRDISSHQTNLKTSLLTAAKKCRHIASQATPENRTVGVQKSLMMSEVVAPRMSPVSSPLLTHTPKNICIVQPNTSFCASEPSPKDALPPSRSDFASHLHEEYVQDLSQRTLKLHQILFETLQEVLKRLRLRSKGLRDPFTAEGGYSGTPTDIVEFDTKLLGNVHKLLLNDTTVTQKKISVTYEHAAASQKLKRLKRLRSSNEFPEKDVPKMVAFLDRQEKKLHDAMRQFQKLKDDLKVEKEAALRDFFLPSTDAIIDSYMPYMLPRRRILQPASVRHGITVDPAAANNTSPFDRRIPPLSPNHEGSLLIVNSLSEARVGISPREVIQAPRHLPMLKNGNNRPPIARHIVMPSRTQAEPDRAFFARPLCGRAATMVSKPPADEVLKRLFKRIAKDV